MRLLVVHAHPVAESFQGALYRTALEVLAARHEVRGLDLYAVGFDPVLTRERRLAYHTAGENERGLEEHVDHLRWAQGMIFVYPTWWYGLPAMLKGWLDRAWLPGVTFTMPEPGKPVGPLMRHVRLLGGISTYGAPWWFTRLVVGDPGRRTILRGLRPLCARGCRTFWLAHYEMDSSTPASRAAFLTKVRERLARV
jgi:putative NADPH-quinone reductase